MSVTVEFRFTLRDIANLLAHKYDDQSAFERITGLDATRKNVMQRVKLDLRMAGDSVCDYGDGSDEAIHTWLDQLNKWWEA